MSGGQHSGAAVPAVGEGVPPLLGFWNETRTTAGGHPRHFQSPPFAAAFDRNPSRDY